MAEVSSRIYDGTIVRREDGRLAVNIRGSELSASFLTGYVPTEGDSVRVAVSDGQAVVLGAILPYAPPLSGEVVSASGGVATLTTSSGTVRARYLGAAPTALSVVKLDWSSTTPWVDGVIQTAPAPAPDPTSPDRPPAPRPPAQTGVLTVQAWGSGSWRPAPGYARWEGGPVIQGRYGSGQAYQGMWFYSQAHLANLRGRQVTGVQIRIPARRRIGNFNQPAPLAIYRHPQAQPAAPGFTHGPVTITLAGNSPGGWVNLPIQIGEALRDGGGGIGIDGSTVGMAYVGLNGTTDDPQSGLLRISWRR